MAIRLCLTFVILLVLNGILYPSSICTKLEDACAFMIKLSLVGIALSGIYYVWMEM